MIHLSDFIYKSISLHAMFYVEPVPIIGYIRFFHSIFLSHIPRFSIVFDYLPIHLTALENFSSKDGNSQRGNYQNGLHSC